jgi:hypothetical protein
MYSKCVNPADLPLTFHRGASQEGEASTQSEAQIPKGKKAIESFNWRAMFA